MAEFPGVAKYPIDEWERANSPMLSRKGWIKLCMRIAQKTLADLHTIFDCAKKLDSTTIEDCLPSCSSTSEASLPPGKIQKKGF